MFMRVEKYSKINAICCDDFVSKAKKWTFFFYRNYMEYHSDRFHDFYLIIYNDKGSIMVLLPTISIRLMKHYMYCFVITQNYIGEMCHFLFICQID